MNDSFLANNPSAGAVEYAEWTSAEGVRPHQMKPLVDCKWQFIMLENGIHVVMATKVVT